MKDKKCSKCYTIIESTWVTTSTYCRDCSSEYYKTYRLNKKPPNVKVEGLGEFIQKIIKNNYYIDFDDISIIIFFYQIITADITEYDRYRTGKQIKLMWDKIYNFYVKKINKQKNI
jgi:hypothetical protein